jgi:hypothetical protein
MVAPSGKIPPGARVDSRRYGRQLSEPLPGRQAGPKMPGVLARIESIDFPLNDERVSISFTAKGQGRYLI